MAPQAGAIVQCVAGASRAIWRRPSVRRRRAGYGASPRRSNLWPSPAPRIRQGETQPPTSHALPLFASTFHKVPHPEKGPNRPRSYLCDFGMQRRRVGQIALKHLVTMWTGVSIEMIAELDATTWTFLPKHIIHQQHEECRPWLERSKTIRCNSLRIQPASQSAIGSGKACTLPGLTAQRVCTLHTLLGVLSR